MISLNHRNENYFSESCLLQQESMIGSYMTGSSDKPCLYSLDIIQGNIHLVPIVLECSNLDSNKYSYPRLHFVHW